MLVLRLLLLLLVMAFTRSPDVVVVIGGINVAGVVVDNEVTVDEPNEVRWCCEFVAERSARIVCNFS